MRRDKIIKIALLNTGIAIVGIVFFSPGIIGLKIVGGSTFQAALGITLILMGAIIFALGNYKLIMEKDKIMKNDEIVTPFDCINALKQNDHKETFYKDINVLLEQIHRIEKKKATIKDLLLQKFSSTEMSFSKFQVVIQDIEKVFYLNIKSVINKLNIFDQEEYNRLSEDNAHGKFSREFIQAKMSIYEEYIYFIKDSVEDNEQILLKLDKLLLELSKFNSLEDGELENMAAMKEIDELISKAKFYK